MKILIPLLLLSSAIAHAADKPNILWLTCEDNNVNWIGCYGNPNAKTPNIDQLAKEGFQFMHCYANAPVCAPQRSTWITGVHAISMGTHPMRSRYAIPHDKIKYYPDLLKQAGYYVGNQRKTDYNIGGRNDGDAWDTNKADWKVLKEKQPFFMVINSTLSHESKAFGDVTKSQTDPAKMKLAKYHPDIPGIRNNYAHYQDQVNKMDAETGKALQALEEAGLAENTIVVHNSDHGGVIARSKRFLFNSGTHCPLIVRIPEKFKHLRPGEPGTRVDDIVSFIDMTKTWLNLCGAETPDYLQGKVFLGPDKEKRDYHISWRTRMDERYDNVRAIRDGKLLYIRNYAPYAPWGQHLNYLWKMVATQAWEEYHKAGKTDEITGRFFGTKPVAELYDTAADPDNVNNLIHEAKYAKDIERLSAKLDEWQLEIHDTALLPESEMVRLAEKAGKTIYEVARDPKLYDVKALQAAAAKALRVGLHPGAFYKDLESPNAGIRYWGIVGVFNNQSGHDIALPKIYKCLEDDSHHVRAMAAWVLYRLGDTKRAQDCWNKMLADSSYASLKIFNILDWIGDDIAPYREAMAKCNYSHNGYVDRMKEYMGIARAKEKGKGKGKKKAK